MPAQPAPNFFPSINHQENTLNAKLKTTFPAAIGVPFEGGFYGSQVRIGAALFAVVWAPKAQGQLEGVWLDSYTDVPGATSCFDSLANTVAMAKAGSKLAQKALDTDINGVKGWCLPARDVLELGYRHFKPGTRENLCSFRDGDNPSSLVPGYPYSAAFPAQTTVEAFRTGGPEAFDEGWYLSSTQYSSNLAWLQNFTNGTQFINHKKFEAVGRLVRLIQLNP